MSVYRRTGVVRRETIPRVEIANTGRYCREGHALTRINLLGRKWRIREETGKSIDVIFITCDGCGNEMRDEYIAGWCQECDIDFCQACFSSGRSIEELLRRGRASASTRASSPIQHCCMVAIAREEDPITAAARGQRYNGKRPTVGNRVNYSDYPDPTNYGWTFTGSCNGGRAEFYEKDFAEHGIVKLDFYYTTGTIKTVLDHPRQGVTQLFAKGSDLSPALFRKILENPRAHTNVRYQQTRIRG